LPQVVSQQLEHVLHVLQPLSQLEQLSLQGTCFWTVQGTSLHTLTFSWTGTHRETNRVPSKGTHLETITV